MLSNTFFFFFLALDKGFFFFKKVYKCAFRLDFSKVICTKGLLINISKVTVIIREVFHSWPLKIWRHQLGWPIILTYFINKEICSWEWQGLTQNRNNLSDIKYQDFLWAWISHSGFGTWTVDWQSISYCPCRFHAVSGSEPFRGIAANRRHVPRTTPSILQEQHSSIDQRRH